MPVRRTAVPILLLAILAALVAVALQSAGQTPPPVSGTWEIYDDTSFDNTSLDIPRSVRIYYGASLTLDNVDITFQSTTLVDFRVDSGGRLDYDGGSISYTGLVPPRFYLVANCMVNGVDFLDTYGIVIQEFGASITNCTFRDSTTYAISIAPLPGSPADRPVIIADNVFTNIGYTSISCYIGSHPGANVRVIIVGNEINGGSEFGAIIVQAYTPNANIIVKGNRIRDGAQDGIRLALTVDNLRLRLDGNTIENVGGHGVNAVLDTEDLDLRGIVELKIDTAGAVGLWFEATGEPIRDLSFTNLTVLDTGGSAITLTNCYDVNLFESTIDTASTNFVLVHSTLGIHRTAHERGSAEVHHDDSRVTSWKFLEMTCVWQSGLPVSRMKVDVLGPLEPLLLIAVTDRDGHWGRQPYCDWYETNDSYAITYQLTPVLVHSRGNITNGALPTEADQVVTVTFNDTALPVINVRYPGEDIVQNTTAFHVNGTCSDAFSGVALVQFSFDPNPDWDAKVWAGATGTKEWSVDTLYLSEGEYTLYVRAFDHAYMNGGLYTQETVGRVVVDLTPPIVQVTDPDVRRQPVIVNTSTITIRGWTSADVTEIKVQRTTVPMAGTAFELEASVSEGLNDITITAVDAAGNTARYTFWVLRDTVPPVITLTAPASGAFLNATSVLVAGLLDEGVQGDHIVINGASVPLSNDAFEFLLSYLDEGPNTIDVTAVDLAGNTAAVSLDIVVDTLPPMLQIVSPNDGLTGRSTVSVEGTTEAGAKIHVLGVPVTFFGTSFTHTLDLEEGRNVIHVTATDAAGNENSTIVVVDRDTLPPGLVVHGLDNGTIESEGPSAVVNGMTEPGVLLRMDVNGTIIEVLVYPDGSFIQPVTVNAAELSITIRAEDAAGNAAFAELTVLRREVPDPTASPPPSPVDPVVTAAVVTSSIIIVVGVALTFEFTKYALVLMVLPLYARIKKHEVLDNKTRLAIHGLVVENPGMHYNEIIREFELTNGVAAYHLDVLEREGFVRSIRDGTLRRFYSSSTKVPASSRATPDQVRENILELVISNPGINQKTIVDELGIGRTLVGYHLKTLIDEGYIEAHKQGRFTVYSRTRKRWFRLN